MKEQRIYTVCMRDRVKILYNVQVASFYIVPIDTVAETGWNFLFPQFYLVKSSTFCGVLIFNDSTQLFSAKFPMQRFFYKVTS